MSVWSARHAALIGFVLAVVAIGAVAPAEGATACRTKGLGGAGWVASSTPSVRVWARSSRPADVKRAAQLASLYEAKIGKRFKALLGRRPVSDAGQKCAHGGDGRLDVYISPTGRFGGGVLPTGVAAAYLPYRRVPCDPLRPGFIVVRPKVSGFILAHEAYHAFQAAFARRQHCIFYSEWDEATATWAAIDAFPSAPERKDHIAALTQPRFFITAPDGYRAWVVPYFAAKRYGRGVLRKIEVQAGARNSNDHVDAALPGGFLDFWATFTLQMWNQDPLPNVTLPGAISGRSVREDLGIASAPPTPAKDLVLQPDGKLVETILLTPPGGGDSYINALGRDYRRYTFSDPSIRSVRFTNDFIGVARGTVAVLIRTPSGWRAEDWSERRRTTLCRDLPQEDVQEIVIAFGNTDTDANNSLPGSATLELGDLCMVPQTVTGSFSGTVATPDGNLSWSGSATFTHTDTDNIGLPYSKTSDHYTLTAATANWSLTGRCTGSGALDLSHVIGDLEIRPQSIPTRRFSYSVFIATRSPAPGTRTMPAECPSGPGDPPILIDAVYDVGASGGGALLYNSDTRGPETNRFSALTDFAGSLSINAGEPQTWTWNLTGSGQLVSWTLRE